MKNIDTELALFVEQQFPEFYQTEGPGFIDFVKQYYAWMEQQNEVLGASRNLFNVRDIDTTTDEFLDFFKGKYLKGLPSLSAANNAMLLKHSRELHASRGTRDGVKLAVKAAYGEESEVYYPGVDVLKTSDGKWVKPVYLELSVSDKVRTFLNQQIIGVSSQSTAFVEKIVRRRVNGKFIDIVYISGVKGDFVTGERIVKQSDPITEGAPKVVGSLTSLTVVTGGAGWNVGDTFDVTTGTGKGAKARVTAISNQTGKVIFTLEDGGWGYDWYTNEVLVSEKVLTIETKIRSEFDFQRTAGAATVTVGNEVRKYANDVLIANGSVLSVSGNSTLGTIVVEGNVGNLVAGGRTLFVGANTATFRINRQEFLSLETFETVSQQLANVAYSTATPNNELLVAGTVLQNYYGNGAVAATGVVVESEFTSNSAGYVVIHPLTGNLVSVDTTLATSGNATTLVVTNYDDTRTAYGNVTGSNTSYVGLHDINKPFVSSSLAPIIADETQTKILISNISTGVGATFSIGTLTNTEDVTLSPDFISSNNVAEVKFRDINLTGTNSNSVYADMPLSITSGDFVAIDPSLDIDGVNNFITSPLHPFSDGDDVIYYVEAGNTAITNLVGETHYYVISSNTSGFKLTTVSRDAGSIIDIEPAIVSEDGHKFLLQGSDSIYFDAQQVDSANNFIPADPHPFNDDEQVMYYVAPGNTAVGGLTSNTNYYVISSNTTGFKLTTEAANTSAIVSITAGPSSDTGHGFYRGDVAYGGFGFVKFVGSNMNSVLYDCLRFSQATIGTIASLTSIDNGVDYNADPFVQVLQRDVAGYGRRDYIARIGSVVGGFVPGELIQQSFNMPAKLLTISGFTGTAANGTPTTTPVAGELVYQSNATTTYAAKGIVYETGVSGGNGSVKIVDVEGEFVVNPSYPFKSVTSGGTATLNNVQTTTRATTARAIVKDTPTPSLTMLYLKRINLEDTFMVTGTQVDAANTSNLAGPIIGRTSGAVADLIAVGQDPDSGVAGLNADIIGDARTADGVATNVAVYASGFGYVPGENVQLTRNDGDSDYIITAKSEIQKQGVGEGYYATTDSFLSSDKKLHDNEYYQDFSYEVQTNISLDTYIEVLKQITHAAGTRLFGRVMATSKASMEIAAINTVEDQNGQTLGE
jgi:hypothetical protein